MTTLHFILSAICIGLVHTCIEWFIIGFLFHKYQALTPQTWRPESNTSYTYSTVLSFLFGTLFTLFYVKIGAHYVLPKSIFSDIKLALICFACFSLIIELGTAIYVNYNKMFVVGKLLASCLNFIAAAIIAGLFYW